MKNIEANFRLTPWLMASALSITLVACGGGGQDTILGAGSVATVVVPIVTVVTPSVSATGVAPNIKAITAKFSKAMDANSLNGSSFTLACPTGTPAVGPVTYLPDSKIATLPLLADLPASTTCTATVTTAAKDITGLAMAKDLVWEFTTSGTLDGTAPTVTSTNPADAALGVATNTTVKATFSEAMNPNTIKAASFTLNGPDGPVAGTVSINPLTTVATFTPSSSLKVNAVYTATVTTAVTDQSGNALATPGKIWTFTTGAVVTAPIATIDPLVGLNTAAPFGTFGGSAGMTNMGTLTIINGDIGTTATGNAAITGFYENPTLGNDVYTVSSGLVNGVIYTCAPSTTGANSAGFSATECAAATQARLDTEAAYLALAGMPVVGASPAPGANLAGVTLLTGTYKAPAGSFLIQGGNLTLDAQGDANATWVFQMATTLTVGGPGAAAPQSIILAGGAQAKNVFWQVGSAATINAAGGSTMVGTIIANDGVTFSTAGNVNIVTLNGRALSLGASVTMVNTVINVPAQ